jgi:peptide-methionine (S)-S-oxide reductase
MIRTSPVLAAALALMAPMAQAQSTQTITVAGGCFWCVEADFEKVDGVIEAVSGFAGGDTSNPTYEEVTGGGTGHYEAVEITYDPSRIDARRLYDLFFRSIDPTDAGGQFCDRGPSYRTAIFADAQDKPAAEAAKQAARDALGREIVTPILAMPPSTPPTPIIRTTTRAPSASPSPRSGSSCRNPRLTSATARAAVATRR